MSGYFLNAFFTTITFPPAIADQVVAAYSAKYATSLAYNENLGDAAAPLVKHKLDVGAMTALAISGNRAVLDALLDSHEAREQVISNLMRLWDFSPADQIRLANRPLTEYLSHTIMRDKNFSPEAKTILAARAPVALHVNWLYQANLSADELLAHLLLVAKKKKNKLSSVIIPELIAHPDLRVRALRSKSEVLRTAACWTELEESLQDEAVEFALLGNQKTELSPVVGLLGQPALRQGPRTSLVKHLTMQGRVAVVRAGANFRSSRIHLGAPLASISGNVVTEVLDAAATPGALSPAQLVSTSMLFELSRNPNLTPFQLERLLYAMCLHDAVTPSERVSPLLSVMPSVALRLEPRTKSAEVLARMGATDRAVKLLDFVHPASVVTATETALRAETSKRSYYHAATNYPESVGESLRRTVEAYAQDASRLRTISGLFTQQLGDATDPVSAHAWMLFIALATEDPDVPLGTVLDTAKQLARAEGAKPTT